MYEIKRADIGLLLNVDSNHVYQTIFTTYEWMNFLVENQKVEPVILRLISDCNDVAIFVGGIIQKFGIKILGSPFEGWLTCDMGFIRLKDINIDDALDAVKSYAFKVLKCHYIQIVDKNIENIETNKYLIETTKVLKIDNSLPLDDVLASFTKNGRRDVRASLRKGLSFNRVSFDREFVEIYYKQLEDVFSKQHLKPFYDLNKLYQLVDAFKDKPEQVCALEAILSGKCVASIFSFGMGEWAYYVGAASYREYQKYLPNEGLFWEFVQFWHSQGVKNIDMVGYREYKLKYNPQIIDAPVVIMQKYPFLHSMKEMAYKFVTIKRKLTGKIKTR